MALSQTRLLKRIKRDYTKLLEKKSGMTEVNIRRWSNVSENVEYFDFDADHRDQYINFTVRVNIQGLTEKDFELMEQGILETGSFSCYTYDSTDIKEGDEVEFRNQWFRIVNLNTGMLGDGSRAITSFNLQERR